MRKLVVLSSTLGIPRINGESSRNPGRCSAWLRAKAIVKTFGQMVDLYRYAPPLARNRSKLIEERRERAFVTAFPLTLHDRRFGGYCARLARIRSQPVHGALHA